MDLSFTLRDHAGGKGEADGPLPYLRHLPPSLQPVRPVVFRSPPAYHSLPGSWRGV